jgi:hypothetical protein
MAYLLMTDHIHSLSEQHFFTEKLPSGFQVTSKCPYETSGETGRYITSTHPESQFYLLIIESYERYASNSLIMKYQGTDIHKSIEWNIEHK